LNIFLTNVPKSGPLYESTFILTWLTNNFAKSIKLAILNKIKP